MGETSRSIGNERAMDEESDSDNGETGETLVLENNLMLSDTLVALRMMHAQFPNAEKVAMWPFIFRLQLYTGVKDRTQVDQDLEGRMELLSFLIHIKYKEMLLAPLEKKHLRLSPLDMRFHPRDLTGSGHLKTLHTPTGLLVRVSKD